MLRLQEEDTEGEGGSAGGTQVSSGATGATLWEGRRLAVVQVRLALASMIKAKPSPVDHGSATDCAPCTAPAGKAWSIILHRPSRMGFERPSREHPAISICPGNRMQATKETWAAYEAHAMGYDELLPLTKLGKNSFSGIGAMVVDCLDTLWLMGLRDEFDR